MMARTHSHAHIHTHPHPCTHPHVFIQKRIHLRPQGFSGTHTHARTHIHTHLQDCSVNAKTQHTATCCDALHRTATHCNTLQHTATHCDTLQHTATGLFCENPHTLTPIHTPAYMHTHRAVLWIFTHTYIHTHSHIHPHPQGFSVNTKTFSTDWSAQLAFMWPPPTHPPPSTHTCTSNTPHQHTCQLTSLQSWYYRVMWMCLDVCVLILYVDVNVFWYHRVMWMCLDVCVLIL